MRRRITQKNYGKFHEAVLISSAEYWNACNDIAAKLKASGIFAEAINFEEYKNNQKYIKKLLSKSYHVIFCLSDNIIKKSLDYGDEHPFLKLYAYAHKTNPFAISCIAFDGYNVQSDLTYPRYMGDFPSLHRINFPIKSSSYFSDYSSNIENAAKTLENEIRRYYNPKTIKFLEGMKNKNFSIHIKSYFDFIISAAPKVLVLNIITFLLLFLVVVSIESFFEGLIFFIMLVIGTYLITTVMYTRFATKKEEVELGLNNAQNDSEYDPIAQEVIRKARISKQRALPKKLIFSFLLLLIEFFIFVYIEYDILYLIAIYLIMSIIRISGDLREASNMRNELKYHETYLDYLKSYFCHKKTANIIKTIIFILASIAITIWLFYMLP